MNNEIQFLKELNKFKLIKRHTHNPDGKLESDSDHSWHLALFIIIFKKELTTKYNYEKLLEIALTHDLPEIYTGDFHPFGQAPKNKQELEEKAAKKLYSILEENKKEQFLNLHYEYENQETKEAKLIKALDKLMPLITEIMLFDTKTENAYLNINIDEKTAKEYISKFCNDELSQEILEILFQEAKTKNIFYK